MRKPSEKQIAVIQKMAVFGNKTTAFNYVYIKCTRKSASSGVSRMLKLPYIKKYIKELRDFERAKINGEIQGTAENTIKEFNHIINLAKFVIVDPLTSRLQKQHAEQAIRKSIKLIGKINTGG